MSPSIEPVSRDSAVQAASRAGKTFAEFFAGIGLVRYGLREGGWRCVYANDLDPKKEAMYRAHFGADGHYHLGDVWDTEQVLQRWRVPAFLATASFPCTDMSLAGRRQGFAGEESSAFFGFARALENSASRPPVVLLENVVGFASSRQGEDFRAAAARLAELGYWLDAFVLDARNFVPQSRPRMFVIGVQRPLADGWRWDARRSLLGGAAELDRRPDSPLRPDALRRAMEGCELSTGWLRLAERTPSGRSGPLLDVLDLDEEQSWWDQEQTERHLAMMTEKHRRRIDALVELRETAAATVFRRIRQGVQRAEPRWDGLAGCLRTPRGGSARQIVLAIVKGDVKMRWMTPREYARLQGAPDFTIECGVHQALFGFGDAVCSPAIEWIDRRLLTPLHEAALRLESGGAGS